MEPRPFNPTDDVGQIVIMILVGQLLLYGCIYIVGGQKRANALLTWELRLLRRMIAAPFLWAGNAIRGGGKKKKKGH